MPVTSTEANPALHVRLVTPGFPPARGGVEEHCHQLAVRLRASGDRVSVLTASRTGVLGQVPGPDDVEVHVYRAWRTRAMSVSPRLAWAAVAPPRDAADITHVHSYHATSGFAALGGVRRPTVFTPHYHGSGHSAVARALHVGYQLVGRAMFAAADAIICVSEAERAAVVRDFPAAAKRIRVIPNGVDRATIRAAAPFPGEAPTALAIGRLEPYKHVETAIRAMADVPGPSQLVVIGTGSERDALEALVGQLSLTSRVRLLGEVETEQLHRWLRTARVLVSLSDHEAFGMVPLEAATAGARVVLSDIPAHREITDKWLQPAAELLPSVAPGSVSDALRRALAATDRVAVDVPDWSDVVTATRDVYLDVIRAQTTFPRHMSEARPERSIR